MFILISEKKYVFTYGKDCIPLKKKYTKSKVIYIIVFEIQDVNHVKIYIYIYIRFPCFINFDINLMKLGDLTLSQLCGLYSNKVTAQA